MKSLIRKFFIIVLAAVTFHACNETLIEEPVAGDAELKSGQSNKITYIVVLEDAELNGELSNIKGYEMRQQATKRAAEKLVNRAGISDGELELAYSNSIHGFSIKIPPGQLKKLLEDPAVVSVTEDKLITLIKPGSDEVTATAAQVIPWGIQRVHGGVTYSGNNVAWIIDTGIDLDHPDLNVGTGKTFVTRTSSPEDNNGHGTHVAGTIAAIDNAEGVVGVAAGALVIPIKVLDRRGSGYYSWIIGGVDYVAGNGSAGDVANMSLGGPKDDPLNQAVINASKKGIKFALAAGNESTNAGTKSPASANGTNIFTVSAMAVGDIWASYSNYGNPPVDYCAPGSAILSTYKNGGYATASGTSMAAPHVAGLLLLGNTTTEGTVNNDPDGNPDPIAVYGGGTSPANNRPVADAGEDITVTEGETVTLNGSGSYDPDEDDILSFSWVFEGTIISTAESFSYDFPVGVHKITLTVSDGTASSSDEIVVTVNSGSTSNVAPEIDDFNLTNTSNPAMMRVQVSWSVSDADGNLKTVETHLSGPGTASAISTVSGFSASGIHELSVKKGRSGEYTVTITVTDAAGITDTETIPITL